jgi:hypothetical protein
MNQKERQTLNVDLGDLKPLLETAAKNHGKRPAALVREALAALLQELGAVVPLALPRVAPNRSRGSAVARFGGRLTAAGSEALRAKAAAEGVSQIELIERMALDEVGPLRARALEVLPGVVDRLLAVEHELRDVKAQLYEPGALALLEKAVCEVRAQAKQTARALDQVKVTRRQSAHRRQA